MPVPRKFKFQLLKKSWVALFLVVLKVQLSWALVESQPIHFSGDKQVWDRKGNRVELYGHAAVSQTGETLSGDTIFLDLKSRDLDAKGNCVYSTLDAVIWGDEMHFNLDTRTGSVIRGRISNNRFTLRGERINKLGPGRFQAHWGNYTTCLDCAASWSLDSEDMDMELEGYAFLSNVTTRIKDAPAFWLPYLVVPLKTRRQTGFLFPRFSFGGFHGTTLVLPLFLATSRNTDMTLGLGEYSANGHRLEWEGRYVLADSFNSGIGKFFLTGDRTVGQYGRSNRWALDWSQNHHLPLDVEGRLRLVLLSDNLYPYHYSLDLPVFANEAFLRSTLLMRRNFQDLSAYVAFDGYRNLLNTAPGGTAVEQVTQSDPRTVQAFPVFSTTLNDRFLFGENLIGGFTFGLTNFTRTAGPFDYDNSSVTFGTVPSSNPPAFRPGVDPIRKATRYSFLPSIYTTYRPFDVISVVPSLQLRSYVYDFGGNLPALARGYFLFQTDISTQLQKIFEFPEDHDYPRVKNVIRPLLTYSLIPLKTEATHPFMMQIQNAQQQGFTGYNFDDNDIVPYSYTQNGAQYFIPLGHSLAYGISSQWIRRKGADGVESPIYQNMIELTAGQAINFLEMTQPLDPTDRHILNRFTSSLNFNFQKFTSQTTYYYNPDYDSSKRTYFATSFSYILERGSHQRIMNFERSISIGYTFSPIIVTSNLTGQFTFSLSDYILPSFSMSYNLVSNQLAGAGLGVQFQSPSQCWKLVTGMSFAAGTNSTNLNFELQLNLTGGGFGSFGQIADQFASEVTGGH